MSGNDNFFVVFVMRINTATVARCTGLLYQIDCMCIWLCWSERQSTDRDATLVTTYDISRRQKFHTSKTRPPDERAFAPRAANTAVVPKRYTAQAGPSGLSVSCRSIYVMNYTARARRERPARVYQRRRRGEELVFREDNSLIRHCELSRRVTIATGDVIASCL